MTTKAQFLADVNKLKNDMLALCESSIELDDPNYHSNNPDRKSFNFDVGENFILQEDIQAQSFKHADIEDILHGKVQIKNDVKYYTLDYVISCINRFTADYVSDEF